MFESQSEAYQTVTVEDPFFYVQHLSSQNDAVVTKISSTMRFRIYPARAPAGAVAVGGSRSSAISCRKWPARNCIARFPGIPRLVLVSSRIGGAGAAECLSRGSIENPIQADSSSSDQLPSASTVSQTTPPALYDRELSNAPSVTMSDSLWPSAPWPSTRNSSSPS